MLNARNTFGEPEDSYLDVTIALSRITCKPRVSAGSLTQGAEGVYVNHSNLFSMFNLICLIVVTSFVITCLYFAIKQLVS